MAHSHQAGEDAGANVCAWHPDVETRLFCSYCGRSICTNCLVQVPVGIRCRECAKTERLPTFDVQPVHYTKGLGVALAVAIGGGIIWSLFSGLFGFSVLSPAFALVIGYAAGELISLSVNRKRGTLLAWIAVTAVIIAFIINFGVHQWVGGILGLGCLAAGCYIAYVKLR